jgi:hypothetical protein
MRHRRTPNIGGQVRRQVGELTTLVSSPHDHAFHSARARLDASIGSRSVNERWLAGRIYLQVSEEMPAQR